MAATGLRRLAAIILLGAAACAFVESLSRKTPSSGARSGAVSSSKGSPLSHAAHALPSGRDAWQMVSSACLAALLLGASCAPAWAESKRVLGGEIPESGFIFKDTINVEAFEDPMVSGVTVYISEIARFGAVPPIPGLTCAKSGPVKIAADLKANNEVEDVFTEARSPLSIRDLRVKRRGQFKHKKSSLCRPCGWLSGEVAADAVSCRKCLIG